MTSSGDESAVGFSRVLSDVTVSYAIKEKTKQVGLGKNNSFIEKLQHTHIGRHDAV